MTGGQYGDFPGLAVGEVPEPGEGDPMSSAEFRMVREAWGFTLEALASLLSVDPRTVRRWESGASRVPDGIRQAIEDLEQQLCDVVDTLTGDLRNASTVTLAIPAEDSGGMPAACWRAIAYRVAEAVPGLHVTYGLPVI